MATTVTFTSEVIVGNNTINTTGYTLNVTYSGTKPASGATYKITKATITRTFRNASTYSFGLKAGTSSGTVFATGIDAQTGGSTSYTSTFTVTNAAAAMGMSKITLYGIGGSSGELASGSNIVIKLTWEEDDKPTTLSSVSSSVACGADLTYNTGFPYKSSYTHTLKVTLGNQSVSKTVYLNSSTTGTIYIPATFAKALPSATSGTATVTLTTKSGSTTIGTSSKTCTITVPTTYKPTVTVTLAPTNGTAYSYDGTDYVLQNFSKVDVAVSTSGNQGSYIRSIQIEGSGISSTTSISGSETSYSLTKTTSLIDSSGATTYTVTVTDSRGRSNKSSANITVTAYAPVSVNRLYFARCNSSGDEIATGTYGHIVSNGLTWTSTLAGNSDVPNMQVYIKKSTDVDYSSVPDYDGTWVGESIFSGLAVDQKYNVRVVISDNVESLIQMFDVATAYVLMRWDPQKRAFGFGGYPTEKNCVEIASDWSLYHDGLNVLETGAPAQVLWTMEDDNSNTMWSDGSTSTRYNLADWQIIQVILDTVNYLPPGVLYNRGDGVFSGVISNVVSGSGLRIFGITIKVTSATSAQITAFEKMRVQSSGVSAYTATRGIIKILGIKHI